MTIADKLTKIAENSRALYEAGYEAGHIEGIDVRRVAFADWHNGTSKESLVAFGHGLGVKPAFVAFVADDISAIERAALPSGINSVICQADGMYNAHSGAYCPATFVRYRESAFGYSSRVPNDGSNRLIVEWDDKYVYVNANGSAEAWAPESVTTYTMICTLDAEAGNVIFGIDADEVVDNSIMKMQVTELSFDDWFTSESEPYYIYHSLGGDPDTVVILPSHHDWNCADSSEGHFASGCVVAGAKRTWYDFFGTYSDTTVDYFDASGDGYFSLTTPQPIIDWSGGAWVRINPSASFVFAPKSEITYKVLIIKHVL